MRRIRKLLRLSLADHVLLLKTAFLILAVRAALSLLPFQTVYAYLLRIGKLPRSASSDTSAQTVQRLIWAVDIASRFLLPNGPCLTRALVAQMLLSRVGYSTTLRIGVARTEARSLQAHAWLERDGEIIVGNLYNLGRFTPLPPLELTRLS